MYRRFLSAYTATMARTLTDDDLMAIRDVLQPELHSLNEKIDDLAIDTAMGFEEVHERISRTESSIEQLRISQEDAVGRISGIEGRLSGVEGHLSNMEGRLLSIEERTERIERIQYAEVSRMDSLEETLRFVRQKLSIA